MATLVAENFKQIPLPKKTVAVARRDGRIYMLDFAEYPQADDPGLIDWDISVSKILISKIQMSRTRVQTLEEITIENIVHTEQYAPGTTKDVEVTVFGTLDGKNEALQFEPTTVIDEDGFIRANCRATATNFGIQLRGTYSVNTITVTIHFAGRR